ncbi:hypothetical protein [Sneathiella aquimaris]|uniref:hypothetical protein n=1 Tax=Sneathiella aquimaris TaxID=2599305 RepID=UPI001469D2FD|nr:hypothetical protein [Sneathiella aquimaris]
MKRKILGILGAMVLSGCTANGGTDNPLVRPFQYFSYLNGDDIRNSCTDGSDSRYRLVFNGLYEQQVRTYDIRQPANARTGVQTTRVFARGIGANFSIGRDGIDFQGTSNSTEVLTYDDLLAIDKALIEAGFERPSLDGQILHSDEFYWIAMVCRSGAFKYFAWTKDMVDIEGLPLLEAVSRKDLTDIEPVPIREPIIHDRGGRNQVGLEGGSYFSLEVGDNGLKL